MLYTLCFSVFRFFRGFPALARDIHDIWNFRGFSYHFSFSVILVCFYVLLDINQSFIDLLVIRVKWSNVPSWFCTIKVYRSRTEYIRAYQASRKYQEVHLFNWKPHFIPFWFVVFPFIKEGKFVDFIQAVVWFGFGAIGVVVHNEVRGDFVGEGTEYLIYLGSSEISALEKFYITINNEVILINHPTRFHYKFNVPWTQSPSTKKLSNDVKTRQKAGTTSILWCDNKFFSTKVTPLTRITTK